MPESPKFSVSELWEHEDDARSALLNRDGALDNPGHWLGVVIDTSRYCRELLEENSRLASELGLERQVRIHGQVNHYEFPANGVPI